MLIRGILAYDNVFSISDTDALFYSLVGTGHFDKAAIFNTQGTSVWASSPGFTVCRPFLLRPYMYLTHLLSLEEVACRRKPEAELDD